MKIKGIKNYLGVLAIIGLLIPSIAQAIVYPTGRGIEGDLTLSASRDEIAQSAISNVNVLTQSAYASTTVASVTGFSAGDYVFIHQTQSASGATAGEYEIRQIQSVSGNDLLYNEPLDHIYGATNAQVIKILEYHDVTIQSGGDWNVPAWDETDGGILVALLTGTLSVESGGTIQVNSDGYVGGAGSTSVGTQGAQEGGEGSAGGGNNDEGGGGGENVSSPNSCDGAGGGHGGGGGDGNMPAFCLGPAAGGNVADDSLTMATTTYMGAGGGGGANASGGATGGGRGGGLIFIFSAEDITVAGTIQANGANASDGAGDGGGGSGGGIRLANVHTLTLGSSIVDANGGSGGGSGGSGRTAGLAGATVSGTASPTINVQSTDEIYNIDNDVTHIMLGSLF